MKILFNLRILAVVVAVLSSTSQSSAAVWETTSNWSPAWEQAYQNWSANHWHKNFFLQNGFYHNAKLDCADAVYAQRLIFAAQNGLPFAMKDSSGGSRMITNRMSRWDHLPREQRLRAFLHLVFDLGGTASLPNDTYPVAVNRRGITAGGLILTDPASHHSWTIKYTSRTGIPHLLFASRPPRTVLFERSEYPTVGFIFPQGIRPETNAGFRYSRTPSYINRPVWEVPGYSLEQYQFPARGWSKQIQRRLALETETADARLSRVMTDACRGAQERVEIVREAARLNDRLGSQCMSRQQFDDYSTPSRDTRLKGSFTELRDAYREAVNSGAPISQKVRARVESVLGGDRAATAGAYCTVQISSRRSMTLGQIYQRSMAGQLSTNPNDSLNARWGLESWPGSKKLAAALNTD